MSVITSDNWCTVFQNPSWNVVWASLQEGPPDIHYYTRRQHIRWKCKCKFMFWRLALQALTYSSKAVSQPQFRKTRSSQPRLKLTCACITMTTVITGTTQRRRAFLLDAQNWDIMTFFVIFFFCTSALIADVQNSRCVIYSCLWRFCITIFFYLSNHCKIHRKRDMGHYSI